ncbi:hypothetical protein ES703_50256 [subsurface metagenome]
MRATSSFTFDCESNICTSRTAIRIGASSVTKLVIAARLFAAAKPATIAAIAKIASPTSMAVKRYKNLLLQRPHTSQKTKANINTADTVKL